MADKTHYSLLSHTLSLVTPVYGSNNPIKIIPDKEKAKGNHCNTYILSFNNHLGTNVDVPLHFDKNGSSISSFSIQELIFLKPAVINCLKNEGEVVAQEDILPYKNILSKCDILICKTGFGRLRNEECYRENNIWVHPDVPALLRKDFQNIRAFGIDSISISSIRKREAGRESHRNFLLSDGYNSKPILIIEDMKLDIDLTFLKIVFVVSLFVEGIDSSQCSVIGEFGQSINAD